MQLECANLNPSSAQTRMSTGVCLLLAVLFCADAGAGAGDLELECPSMAHCSKCTFSRCKVTNFGLHFPRKAQVEKLLVRDVTVVDLGGCVAWLRNLSFAQWGELLVSNSVSFLQCLTNLDEPLHFHGAMDLVSISAMSLNESFFEPELRPRAFSALQSVATYTMHQLGLSKVPQPLAEKLRVTGLLNLANNNIGVLTLSKQLAAYNLKELEDLDVRHNPTCLFFANATKAMRNWTRIYFGSDSQYLSALEMQRRSVSGLFRRSDSQCADGDDADAQLRVRLIAAIVVAVAVCALLVAAIIAVRLHRKKKQQSLINQL